MSKEIRQAVASIILEGMDDVRHKVVEQGWSGQEQTGYLQNIYGTDFTNQTTAAQESSDGLQDNGAQAVDPNANYVGFEQRPDEQAGWWHGEPETRNGMNDNDNHAARNGWGIGQDASETREALEAKQDSPEQEM